jgi:hypothetical protein
VLQIGRSVFSTKQGYARPLEYGDNGRRFGMPAHPGFAEAESFWP